MDHFGHIPDLPSPPSQPHASEFSHEWLMARIEMILSAYRKADYHNPEAFMMQVAINLRTVPKEIIEYVSAPETGIQRRLQWPPTLAEIVEACAAEIAWRQKIKRYSAMRPTVKALPQAPLASGVQGDGGPGTIYTAKAFDQAVANHGRPTGFFERQD